MKKILALMICILMIFSLTACAEDSGNADEENVGVVDETTKEIADENGEKQTLEGTAQGYGGEVKVTVEVKGDDIVKVEAVGENETEGIGSKAIEELPAKIEEADSTDVEGVSGATFTSNAIKEAVNKALEGKK